MKRKVEKVGRVEEANTSPENTAGEFRRVRRDAIRPDPDQPRRTFDEGKLAELRLAIKERGILQPPVVQEKEDGYQIIFGERRWRAAGPGRLPDGTEWAGLDELPVIVRTVTERDVFALQFIENNCRENLTALEEAAGFARQLEKRKGDGFNADALASEVGVARGTVYNRLALLRLREPVRQALVAGRISVSVAGLVAMVPSAERQNDLLKRLTDEESPLYPLSYRDVERMLEEEYAKPLKDAPFDAEDATLAPVRYRVRAEDYPTEAVLLQDWAPRVPPSRQAYVSDAKEDDGQGHKRTVCHVWEGQQFDGTRKLAPLAGPVSKSEAEAFLEVVTQPATVRVTVERCFGGGCKDCPLRSGNSNAEFKNPNVCTEPGCYQAKCRAHWLRQASAAETEGKKVLTPQEFRRVKGEYVAGSEFLWAHNGGATWKEHMGSKAPEPTLVVTDHGLEPYYPREAAVEAARANGVKFRTARTASLTSYQEQVAEQKMRQERMDAVERAMPELANRLAKLSEAASWKVLACALKCWPDGGTVAKRLLKAAKSDRARVVAMIVADRIDGQVVQWDGEWNPEVLAIYKAAGVDVKKLVSQ